MNCEQARSRRKRALLRARGFTLLELAVAAAIFLTASAGLTLVVTQVLSTNALSAEQLTIRAALSSAASQIVSAPGAYEALLNNTFSVPDPCANQSAPGTGSQSCLVASGTTWPTNWGVQIGSPVSSVGSADAAFLTLTGRVVLANGAIISVSRVVSSPSFAYSSANGLVRVSVSDPGNLFSGSVYLLSMANPAEIVTSGPISGGVALLSAPAQDCTSQAPCVLGLTSGNDYAVSGGASMIASQMTGPGAQIVLSAGAVTSAALNIRGVGQETLSLVANNLSTTQAGVPSQAGSICLYANFNDGVANQSVPVCNFTDASTITMYDYAPDPSRPNVRVALPLNTPISLSTDPASGICPYVANPVAGSAVSGLMGWSGTGWVGASGGVCTSWTWGNPTSFSSNGTTTNWAGATVSLTGGVTGTGTVTWSGNGNPAGLYVLDQGSGAIRLSTPNGLVSTLGSSSTSLSGITEASNGTVFYSSGNAIYEMSPTGASSLLAGSPSNAGSANGTAGGARFDSPHGLGLSPDGATLYVADSLNNSIRTVDITTGAVGTLSLSGISLSYPSGLAVEPSGNIVVADQNHCQIDQIAPSGAGGILAGSGTCGYQDGAPGAAQFKYPQAVAVDSSGNVYVADSSNNRIRLINSSGTVSTIAGSGSPSEKDGLGVSAALNYPTGITWLASGVLFVTDANGQTLRSVNLANNAVSTVAGGPGVAGEVDGLGSAARFSTPVAVASYSGVWNSAQPALGFGTVSTWTMPRDMEHCVGGCLSLGTSVPENTACPTQACNSANIGFLMGPDTGGLNTVLVTGPTGVTVNIYLNTVNYFGQGITAKVTATPGMGTLTSMSGTSLGIGSTIGATGAGGGVMELQWHEGSSAISQTWFSMSLSAGATTTSYDVGLYRSAGAWLINGGGVSIAQGGSGKLSALITQADGTLASGDAVSFSCANCPSGVSFSPSTANAEVNGVASSLVFVGPSSPAGTYAVTISSGGRTAVGRLSILPVAGSVTMSLTSAVVTQGFSTTASVSVSDSAGNPMSGVGVSIVAYSGASVASGLYAPSGGCVTDASGSCSVDILAQGSALVGTYSVEALSGVLSTSGSVEVLGTPSYIIANNVTAVAGGAGVLISAEVLDGSQAPMAGVGVFFSTGGTLTLSSNNTTTNSSGVASTEVSAPAGTPAGTYTVYAQSGTVSYPISVTVS